RAARDEVHPVALVTLQEHRVAVAQLVPLERSRQRRQFGGVETGKKADVPQRKLRSVLETGALERTGLGPLERAIEIREPVRQVDGAGDSERLQVAPARLVLAQVA